MHPIITVAAHVLKMIAVEVPAPKMRGITPGSSRRRPPTHRGVEGAAFALERYCMSTKLIVTDEVALARRGAMAHEFGVRKIAERLTRDLSSGNPDIGFNYGRT
jgi:hypothetical protein